MIKKTFLNDQAETLISSGSILVTGVYLAASPLTSFGSLAAFLYEADGTTPICQLYCNAILSASFEFNKYNHSFELTTPFLAPRGVFVRFWGAGLATCTVTYMNTGA